MNKVWLAVSFGCALLLGCTGEAAPIGKPPLTREQLLNPETCNECHPNHYRQWSASMHAYASEDPVFRAMNARGQREAQIGDFCVRCHAPMAVSEGLTTDGLNLDQLPNHAKGVTCYFCHNATGVGEPHNNSLSLANDTIMRGSLDQPVKVSAHGAEYSAFLDRNRPESAAMCGSCHDIVTPMPKGVHLERTFSEYKQSLFAKTDQAAGTFQTCQMCHMDQYDGVAAVNVPGVDVPARKVHEHLWPAVDVALTPFPDQLMMRLAVEQCQLPYSVLKISIEPADGFGLFKFWLEAQAGHNLPSGSSHDRRVWLEVVAYDAQGRITHQSGVFGDDELENFSTPSPAVTFHDRIFNQFGEEVHMFWDAAPSAASPDGYDDSRALPFATTTAALTHGREVTYQLSTSSAAPTRATVRLRMRPIGRDVLDDLVRSGDLDPAIPLRMPTFTMQALEVTWNDPNGDPGEMTVLDTTDRQCRPYKCLLQGGTPESCGIAQQ